MKLLRTSPGKGRARRGLIPLPGLSFVVAALVLSLLATSTAGDVRLDSRTAAPVAATTVDATTTLARSLPCGMGPRFGIFVKTMVLLGRSTGWAFQGKCNAVWNPDAMAWRPEMALFVFRDAAHNVQYVAWYDSVADVLHQDPYFGGIQPHSFRLNTPAYGYIPSAVWMFTMKPALENINDPNNEVFMHEWVNGTITHSTGCLADETECYGTQNFVRGGEHQSLELHVPFSDGTNLWVTWISKSTQPGLLGWFASIFVGIAFTFLAGIIGGAMGLSGPALSAFSAGIGTFATGIAQGKDPLRAFLEGSLAAVVAFVGTALIQQGQPDALVGVGGQGCPSGDQCFFMKWLDKVPVIKHLAEVHDPFIVWSQAAFPAIGGNAFYLAVTIPPFLVPGCLATPSCVTAVGTMVGLEKERTSGAPASALGPYTSSPPYARASQSSTGKLILGGSDARGNATNLSMAAGTSPSIAHLAGGGYEVAFQAANAHLSVTGAGGTFDTGFAMRAGTSPAITALARGGYQVAFQAANGHVWTAGSAGSRDWGYVMMAGTSPSIAGARNGGYQIAFQAGNGHLWTTGSAGAHDWAFVMKAGTSPDITALTNGVYEMAFQTSNGHVLSASTAGSRDWSSGIMAGTSPSIAGLTSGAYEIAFQATTGHLWIAGGVGKRDTGYVMVAGTSPSIAALRNGSYELAFQARTGNLWTVGSVGHGAWPLVMRAGTSPALAG